MRVCSVPGCPTIHDNSTSRCPTHESAAKQAHWSRTKAYNTRGHRAFRDAVLRRDPICVIDGLAQATVADHHPHSRIELIELGLNPNDPQYGRGLCKKHHDQSTAEMYPSGWAAR